MGVTKGVVGIAGRVTEVTPTAGEITKLPAGVKNGMEWARRRWRVI